MMKILIIQLLKLMMLIKVNDNQKIDWNFNKSFEILKIFL